MEISKTEVQQIASLARLELSNVEIDSVAHDLGAILGHIRALEEVDVRDVSPVGGASEHTAPMRTDQESPDSLALTLDDMAPAFQDGLFLVPRLAALDADALAAEGPVS